MKNIFAIVLIFSLVSGLTVYAQDASKKSVKSDKPTRVKEQSKKGDAIDAVGQQYLDMLKDYNDQLQEAKDNIEKNRKYVWINHEYVMKLRAIARQHGDSKGWIQEDIDKAQAEADQYDKDFDRLKIRIQELQQEKQKLKIDALKYYKSKLPQSFKNKWDEIETE